MKKKIIKQILIYNVVDTDLQKQRRFHTGSHALPCWRLRQDGHFVPDNMPLPQDVGVEFSHAGNSFD